MTRRNAADTFVSGGHALDAKEEAKVNEPHRCRAW
ncbi:hypothetical protein M2267_002600 [Ensifer sp. KUDG1]